MKKEELRVKLTEAGFNDEQLKVIETFIDAEKQESYQAGVGNAYTNIDAKVEELFGIKKQEREMTSIYLDNAFTMFKQGFELDLDKKYKTIKDENKSLKLQLESNPDASKYEDLKRTFNETIEKHEKEKSELMQSFESNMKRTKIESYINSLKFKEDLEPDYLMFKKQSVIDEINKRGFQIEESEGKIILKGGESEGHRNYNLDEFAKDKLKDLFATTSSLKTPEITPSSNKLKSVKSQDEFYSTISDTLIEKGISITDSRWTSEYNKLVEANKSILDAIPQE